MSIKASIVMELRAKTGAGMMDCKKALIQTEGDIEKAIVYLREKGIAKAGTKAERETKEGIVYSYIHSNNKLGVLLEVNCETDFVARTEDFIELCKNISMHIAAANPFAISKEELDEEIIKKERDIYRNKALMEGKPEKIVDKIVDGQIEKYISQVVLLEQEYVKNSDMIVSDLIKETIAKLGENIQVARFVRFQIS